MGRAHRGAAPNFSARMVEPAGIGRESIARLHGWGARDGVDGKGRRRVDLEGVNVFGWALLDGAGEELGRSPSFADAQDAEDWIGSCWRDLLENGVEEVVLYDQASERRLLRMGLVEE